MDTSYLSEMSHPVVASKASVETYPHFDSPFFCVGVVIQSSHIRSKLVQYSYCNSFDSLTKGGFRGIENCFITKTNIVYNTDLFV